ncbi:MAG: hypothetical protein J0L88_04105 [Xanthomonadales bacterium]|nr:hypothetical protein [Xanthomonadales bacterium]
MLLRLAIAALTCLCPLLVAAQPGGVAPKAEWRVLSIDELLAAPAAPAGVAGTGAQVIPLWASEDGRLLAIVGMSQRAGAPILPPSPAFGGVSDLRIIDATNLFSTGLRWRPGHGLRADVMIGVPAGGTAPSYSILGCTTSECAVQSAAPERIIGSLGAGWTSAGERPFDLSFGLSWLESGPANRYLDPSPAAQDSPFTLLAIDSTPYRIDSSRTLAARGSWQIDGGMLDLTAGLGRATVEPLWFGVPGAAIELDQASLGLGIAGGSLRGSIVGHVITADTTALLGVRRWAGIDLGLSWRTPWRGEVSFGAQNLWSAPLDAPREAEAPNARMPYVQYRQDL